MTQAKKGKRLEFDLVTHFWGIPCGTTPKLRTLIMTIKVSDVTCKSCEEHLGYYPMPSRRKT